MANREVKIIADQLIPIRPAATVVILRDGQLGLETLLLQRNSKLAFAAGAWVFPGGSVDQADLSNATSELQAYKHAAIRETMEECGLTLFSEDLVHVCNWTTPEGESKRFATWFFVSTVRQPSQPVVIDGSEIHHHKWMTAQSALDAHHQNELNLMAPTYLLLRLLRHYSSAQQARDRIMQRQTYDVTPRLSQHEGRWVCLYPGDAGYEENDWMIEGPRHRTIIDRGQLHYEHSGDDCPEPAMDAP